MIVYTSGMVVQVACRVCDQVVVSDSLPAALAKFEEKVEAPK